MPNYVYYNPVAAAANTLSGGANTLGESVLRMAILRQQAAQRDQEFGLQRQQLEQQQNYQNAMIGQGQQRIGLEQLGENRLNRTADANIAESNANLAYHKQRLEDAVKLQRIRDRIGTLMPQVGQTNYPQAPTNWPAPGFPPPGLGTGQPALGQPQMQELQGLIGQSLQPHEALQTIAALKAIQSGDPYVQQVLATGHVPQRQAYSPYDMIDYRAQVDQAKSDAATPQDLQNSIGYLRRGQVPPPPPKFAVNPKTGQRIVSHDGGATWQPTQ